MLVLTRKQGESIRISLSADAADPYLNLVDLFASNPAALHVNQIRSNTLRLSSDKP